MQENPQKIDPDSGLPFCVFHNDRVEHFYCEAHKVISALYRPLAAESAFRSATRSQTAKSSTSTWFLTLSSTSTQARQRKSPTSWATSKSAIPRYPDRQVLGAFSPTTSKTNKTRTWLMTVMTKETTRTMTMMLRVFDCCNPNLIISL